MHILLINLTRFGDLLQTQPLISAMHNQGHQVSLVCLDTFQGTTALLRDVHQVCALPGARLLTRLDQHWSWALHDVLDWARQTLGSVPDRIINITPTLAARLLGRALGQGLDGGFGLDAHGFGQYSTPWAAFLQAASTYRGCSPFNLVDLFQRVAGYRPGSFALASPAPEWRAQARALLPDAPGYVAFQLGASQDYRRWPVSAFVEAGREIWQQSGHVPVLLGTAAEGLLGDEFSSLAEYPFVNLMGQTGLQLLAGVLSQMHMLLTNDTGTMHLAAGLGVPVVALFLATAQPFDTGPYLAGSISLEPDMPCHPCSFGQQCPYNLACRDHIQPHKAGALIARYLTEQTWSVPDRLGARVWQARPDADGFMNLHQLGAQTKSERWQWIQIQRQAYRQFLDEQPMRFEPARPWSGSALAESAREDIRRAQGKLAVVTEQARVLSRGPQPVIQKKFLAHYQQLYDIFHSSQNLGVLGHLWHYQSQDAARSMDTFVSLCERYQDLCSFFEQSLIVA